MDVLLSFCGVCRMQMHMLHLKRVYEIYMLTPET